MSVTSVGKDPESLTVTVTTDVDATVERAWQLWADPRQFEQWWGPSGYQSTVVDRDLRAGGRITFFMAGAEGERRHSTWEVIAADPPRHLELRDTDIDGNGRPNDGNGMTDLMISIGDREGGGAVMAIRTHFDSQEGMEEGAGSTSRVRRGSWATGATTSWCSPCSRTMCSHSPRATSARPGTRSESPTRRRRIRQEYLFRRHRIHPHAPLDSQPYAGHDC